MANSSIIGKSKRKIIKEFTNDDEIVKAIDSSTITDPEELIGTHIFDYDKNPNTINTVETFILVLVNIPTASHYFDSTIMVTPRIEIWIVSHFNHMKVNNIPKINMNRNDYLAELIDRKINGRTDFGIGEMKLESNTEGAFQADYVYRRLIFIGQDINASLCKEI